MRALWTLGAIILGIAISTRLPSENALAPVIMTSLGCAFVAGSIRAHGRWKSASLLVAVMCIASSWTQHRIELAPAHRLDRIITEAMQSESDRGAGLAIPVEIRGTVLKSITTKETPRRAGDPPTWSSSQTSTLVRIDSIYQYALDTHSGRDTWTHSSGTVRLLFPGDIEPRSDGAGSAVRVGDRIQLIGLFSPPGKSRNIGEPDWAALGAQSKRAGTIVLTDESLMRRIQHDSVLQSTTASMRWYRAKLNTRALNSLKLDPKTQSDDVSTSDTQIRAMLAALLLGERDPSFGEVYETFQRVGVAHVLAISGFHLALVIMISVVMLRLVGEHPRTETFILVMILIFGALVIPMRPPIVRAGIIVVSVLLSSLAGRRYDRFTVLAWVAAGLLIWRPLDIFSLGYQLSIGITALLIVMSDQYRSSKLDQIETSDKFDNFDKSNKIGNTDMSAPGGTPAGSMNRSVLGKVCLNLFKTIKTNIACWAVAMPAIMYHAGILSLLAPFVSVALIPMIIVLMMVGYLQVVAGVISPELSVHTLALVESLASLIRVFIDWVDRLPLSSVHVGKISIAWTIAATLLMAYLVTRKPRLLSIGKRQLAQVCLCILVLAWFFIEPVILRDRSVLRIDMLDVGDGTCVLVQSDGHGIVWDCGSLNRRVGKMVGSVAREAGIYKIQDAIVTHDNLDHYNGLADLAPIVGLKRVWITKRMMDLPSESWSSYQSDLEYLGIEIRTIEENQRFKIGKSSLTVLWPIATKGEDFSDNNISVVARIDVDVHNDAREPFTQSADSTLSVLLTGDIEREAMAELVTLYRLDDIDVMELPHHGSAKPGASDFVERIDPRIVLQSTGPSRLNDPRWDHVRLDREWYTTALNGGISLRVLLDGEITTSTVLDHP
jgi:competence protein ComEC